LTLPFQKPPRNASSPREIYQPPADGSQLMDAGVRRQWLTGEDFLATCTRYCLLRPQIRQMFSDNEVSLCYVGDRSQRMGAGLSAAAGRASVSVIVRARQKWIAGISLGILAAAIVWLAVLRAGAIIAAQDDWIERYVLFGKEAIKRRPRAPMPERPQHKPFLFQPLPPVSPPRPPLLFLDYGGDPAQIEAVTEKHKAETAKYEADSKRYLANIARHAAAREEAYAKHQAAQAEADAKYEAQHEARMREYSAALAKWASWIKDTIDALNKECQDRWGMSPDEAVYQYGQRCPGEKDRIVVDILRAAER
jgi:hypothetical protein